MKIILMGAPGCGKGTQSPFIKERYHLCHLSSGDLLREAVQNKTPNGIKAKAAMDAGELVSEDIVFGILKDNMSKPECSKGYILDGVPRTVGRAERLEAMGEKIDKAVLFQVPDAVIIERTSGRWLHRASGRTYHEKFAPPKVIGKDDQTGEPLVQRNDDKKEVVATRLQVYHREMAPIEEFYKKRGVFEAIDGNRSMTAVRDSLVRILDPLHEKLNRPWWKFW